MAVRLLIHLPHLQRVDSGGLFHQDMQAMAHGGDGQRRMLVMGDADEHRVTRTGRDQLFALTEYGDIRQLFMDP